MLNEFLSSYGMEIVSTIVIGIIGFIGIAIKTLIKNVSDDKTKSKVAKTAVRAVERLYKDANGDKKFAEAMGALIDMLREKGITITDLEAQMLIEEAVTDLKIEFGNIKNEANKTEVEEDADSKN